MGRLISEGRQSPVPHSSAEFSNEAGFDENEAPSGRDVGSVDMGAIDVCKVLDHSDTDNATRLICHHGEDLTVIAQEGVATGDWLVWTGTHWDAAEGAALAWLKASKIGDLIGLEADVMEQTPQERRAIERAAMAEAELEELEKAMEKAKDADPDLVRRRAKLRAEIDAGEEARAALDKRKVGRRRFGVSSKNKAKIAAMLDCAAPKLRRPAHAFNVDQHKVACSSHTLVFGREQDMECPDPEIVRYQGTVNAVERHERRDWITACIPFAWAGKDAPAPKWRAFLDRMMPDLDRRRTMQQFAGTGLLGLAPQFVMFHYGAGANGKSVFLETLTRVLGQGLAVGLPRESVVGGTERGTGSASPDLVRLYGKRMVRILEVKGDVPLQEDLIKRLTGGEAFPVRSLFKGYFEFQSFATPHMSGNGFPTIDGTDNGIWRRLLVMHWDQTVPEEERRDFEEMVSELVREESAGILAWLAAGAMDYLANGLVIAEAVRASTAGYREEMDPIGDFLAACVRPSSGIRVQANDMYQAYVSWSLANAKRARTTTKFGRVLGQRFKKEQIGGRFYYTDIELHDVPSRPDDPRTPAPHDGD
ncbi:hypothetical protein BA190_10095 [Labrys sp. WJW]|uniref:DNA primase family protein n=1 Tax=Labrys sp. WJW TaxID=1737983 RepID=UPI00082CAF56|nr:phage/plasmid primase, P4 family [Labrys sp. WJW]OCC05244.1 hypothetical protein BA190_10095 [Labrys sp. WJW]